MAMDFEVSVTTTVAPEVAWELQGDPGRVGEWFAPITECVMDGDTRHITMASGAVLVERIEHHEGERAYSYSVLSGIPGLTSHRATLRAEEADGGTTMRWRQTATSSQEGYDIESRLRAPMTAALENLRDILEGRG